MNFVKIGRYYVNPVQVVRVRNSPGPLGEESEVTVELVGNKQMLVGDQTIEEVIRILNEGL